MARASLQLTLAAAFLLLNCLRGSAAAASRRGQGRRLLQVRSATARSFVLPCLSRLSFSLAARLPLLTNVACDWHADLMAAVTY